MGATTQFITAWSWALDELCALNMSQHLHQNKIDVTEIIDFHKIADRCELTEKEYNHLIDDTQKMADIAVKNFLKTD